ncbi:hypothetical protein CY35_01G020500 [Sphagnum magellanicum]|nr:hypothetical protein CY35_01G020500 [Sphagnum magellanicum]
MASRSLCVLFASPLHFPAIVATSQRGSGGGDGIRLCAVMTRTSTSKSSVRMMTGPAAARRRSFAVTRAQAEDGGALTQEGGSWGEPVSLGTAILPPDVDLPKLEALLFQWGNSITQNASLPLPYPLKVDKVEGGVRLGYISLNNGVIENLVHIDVIVSPAEGDSNAMFQALRNGRYKDKVPPGEPVIMQSLLQALRQSIQIARN